MMEAKVVLPTPGGPQRINDGILPLCNDSYRAVPDPMTWV
jgi:hypothetical protein